MPAPWAPESWPPSPSTAAASPRPPASCATWPSSRPASAAPASTASPHRRRLPHPGRARPPGRHRDDITRWTGLTQGRGACHHPDGTIRLVRSALTTFAPELDAHARGLCTATDPTPLLPVPQET
ncbi:hypothetical protein O1M54_14900 [Streptomyces diastatochromogenes]|nr:hypothetical protein [Streptomyces diastatochromogenes]